MNLSNITLNDFTDVTRSLKEAAIAKATAAANAAAPELEQTAKNLADVGGFIARNTKAAAAHLAVGSVHAALATVDVVCTAPATALGGGAIAFWKAAKAAYNA